MRGRPIYQHPLLWIIVIFLALAAANGFIIPSFESMDEPEHFNYMRYLADGHGLPDQLDVATALEYNYYQEGGQPPLYYILGSLVLRALGEDVDDVESLTVPNPFSTCGDLTQTVSKGLWTRDPRHEAPPWHGAALGNHAVRLLSAVFGAVTVVGVHATARSAFPGTRNVGLVAAALVAFNPRFLVLSGTVTNDTLLAALCAWGLYLCVQTLRQGPSWPRSIALGTVAGLASLTKVSGLFLLPLAGLALLGWLWRSREWARFGVHLTVVAVLALAIGGWWYLSNLARYGDPGFVPLLTQDTGRRAEWPARLVVPEIRKFYESYWTAANYCELRYGFFPLYAGLSVLGVVGLVPALRRSESAARRSAALLGVWTLLIILSWATFNSMVFAPNGRYLFQANAAIGSLLAAGILALVGRWPVVWRGLVLGLAAMAMVTPVGVLGPLFAAPPARGDERFQAEQPLEAIFGDRVRLLGYELNTDEVQAGEEIGVTLYLSAVRPITESLALGLQLKSAGPNDDAVLSNLRNWPGGGNLPTTAWLPGEVYADRYSLRVREDVREVQDWELRLMFFEYPRQAGSDDRLPVFVGGTQGGPYVVLARVRVEPIAPASVPGSASLMPPSYFGESKEVALEGADVSAAEDHGHLEVTLWWRVREPPGGEYTVFVHLLDDSGQLVGSGDSPPRGGAMPTSRWRSGDLVVDVHIVPLPDGLSAGTYRVGVGLYDDAGRLFASGENGERLPGDTVFIGEWENGGL
jgi:4-amino-4-deoxy-L-arabinose transferase-like glycosyltransferase